jgi:hypothetical protein
VSFENNLGREYIRVDCFVRKDFVWVYKIVFSYRMMNKWSVWST